MCWNKNTMIKLAKKLCVISCIYLKFILVPVPRNEEKCMYKCVIFNANLFYLC